MENDLPYGSDSGGSAFQKIKGRLSGIPSYLLVFLAVLAVTIVIAAVYFLLPKIQKGLKDRNQNIWEPYVPTVPLAHGRQTYRISGGTAGLPTISEVILDPEDPEMGSTQTISVKANYGSAIKEVSVVLHTDDKDTTQVLQLSSGTATNGEWKGSWKVVNSYEHKYSVTAKAKNEQNLVQMVTVTLR